MQSVPQTLQAERASVARRADGLRMRREASRLHAFACLFVVGGREGRGGRGGEGGGERLVGFRLDKIN